MFKFVICPFLAYVSAAPMTPLISFDLTKTEWLNVWTYVWLGAGWAIWGVLCFVLLFLLAVSLRHND